MPNFLAHPLEQLPAVIITVLIAFTFHEWTHGLVALAFGDDTAKNQGRLSLNPLVHVDLIGLLLIIIAGFGWAKPTPVNRFKLKKRRLGGILVSLVGPISNFILAFIALGIFSLYENVSDGALNTMVANFFSIFIQLNLVLFIFNLIPIPPLDGYQIMSEFLPQRLRTKLEPIEQYALLIFLIVALTPISHFTITPIFTWVEPWLFNRISAFFLLFYT